MPRTARILPNLAVAVAFVAFCGVALADDRDVILASCAQTLGLSPSGCGCIADKATSEFNDKEFVFFMAMVSGDKGAQASTQGALTMEEQVHVGSRMTAMPGECAG